MDREKLLQQVRGLDFQFLIEELWLIDTISDMVDVALASSTDEELKDLIEKE